MKGDVLCDEVSRALYATAACIFQITPAAVVVPRDREDVVRTVRYAASRGLPLTARGAGSGLAGQTVGEGVILDFSKYMNRIIETVQRHFFVRVQPGVVLGDLNRHLGRFGLLFPPDPSSGETATIGGMIGNNASGAHMAKYGATREHVLDLECVLDDGSISGGGRWRDLARRMERLTADRRELIERYKPDVRKNSSGYHLYDRPFDMNRLIVGSEGTLALVTEAKLRMVPLPPERALLRISFDDVEKMGEAVQKLIPLGPSALEVIDKTMIDLVRGSVLEDSRPVPDEVRAILLCEFDGDRREDVMAGVGKARDVLGKARDVAVATGPDMENLWNIRKAASPILDRMEGPLRSTRIIEDTAVHPDRLVAYLQELKRIFARHGVQGVIFGHAGSGQVHVNVLMNLRDPAHQAKVLPICEDVAELAASLKGSLSGEHGDGLLRAPWLRRMFGGLYPVFEEVKRTFDPGNILNPGKKLAPPDYDFRKHLRGPRRPDFHTVPGSPFAPWVGELEKCNGCGHCRTYCPVYGVIPDEAAAPRGKAAAFLAALEGRIAADPAALRKVADLCINCKLCLVLCPSRVDIPGVCLEAKAYDVSQRGLSGRDALFVHARENAARAARWAPLSNWAMPLLGAVRGIARAPKFVRADVKPSRKSDRKVIYFAGCFADFNDPLGEKRATIEILERNGFEVVIPEYRCCGLAALSLGARREAAENAQYNVKLLEGTDLPIVTSAPSCGLMMRMELPRLIPGEAARRVAARVKDVHEFLADLHAEGRLDTGFKRVASTIVFHPTCHMRAMGADEAARRLLRLVPELRLVDVPRVCCGMGGSYGMKSENAGISLSMGRNLFTAIRAKDPTLLTASNGPCCRQLSEGTGREAIHTMTLLHRAYGLSPLDGFHKTHEGVALESLKNYMDKSQPDE